MGSGASTGGQPSPIVDFYLGTSSDPEGRRIEEIWDWDDGRLEGVHNFIQWLFPLRTRSAFSARAPVLSEAEIARFRESELLRQRLARSLDTMLRFYGLQLRCTPQGDPVVEKSPAFASRRVAWLNPGNHNHLRLTRILTSVFMLGLPREALALQQCLIDLAHKHPEAVTRRTLRFWEVAVPSTTERP
jgi:Opioid growth factor receptor (OGFr) conserved region